MTSLARTLWHLTQLVAVDTRNPPRQIGADGGIFEVLRAALGPTFRCETKDLGDGCVSLLAVRGTPRLLFNFHVDTVPAAGGYSADPLTLRVEDKHAVGLGACDTKGAAACMLAVLEEAAEADVALLFTSDEEAGSSRCVKDFCESGALADYDLVVVAEPTEGQVVLDHRGIATATVTFRGTAGHASSGLAERDSALHHAVEWAHQARGLAALDDARSVGELKGICFNLGRLEGGQKPNMIAEHAEVRFGFRPLPSDDAERFLAELAAHAEGLGGSLSRGFVAPSLPASEGQRQQALDCLRGSVIELGAPVSFWTEAALFAAAGTPAVVLGPGSIEQAHTADEWVALDQLEQVCALYSHLLGLAEARSSDSVLSGQQKK